MQLQRKLCSHSPHKVRRTPNSFSCQQMAAVVFLLLAPTAIYLCLAYLALCTPYKFVPALYAAWFVYSIDLPNTGSKSEL